MVEVGWRIWQMSWEGAPGVEQCQCGLGDIGLGCWRGGPTRSICAVQLYLKVLQETILMGFHITHKNGSTCPFAALQMRWCHGTGNARLSEPGVENCPFWYPESPECPWLSSKESTANCMLKFMWGNGKTSVSITGPIWISHQGGCSSQRCDLLCHCSWQPGFLALWHLPGSSAEDSLLLWVLWDCSQNFLCVFSPPVCTGISFIFMEQLDISQRHTFIKAVSMQLLIPAINPSALHYPRTNPAVSALIPSQMLCLDVLCPAFLAGWGLWASFQESSPKAPFDCGVISDLV